MTGALAAYSLIVLGGLLDIQSLAWEPGNSTCFAADSNGDDQAEVFAVSPKQLRVFGKGREEPLLTLPLPAGISAIDVADLDRDGVAELVAVRGKSVLSVALDRTAESEPSVLFECENQYSRAVDRPFPCVLVVDREGVPAIALPQRGTLEIRDLAGALVESYPVDVNTPQHLSISRPFSYWINQHVQSGPEEALEFRISSVVSYRPLTVDEELTSLDFGLPAGRTGTPRQQREASDADPEGWPWFAVGPAGGPSLRALYRIAQPHPPVSAVRLRSVPEEGAGEITIGPSRSYPGTLLLPAGQSADFTGDGYADLALWKAAQPSLATDTLSRIANTGVWPVTITVHPYMPEKRRFAPRPFAHLVLDLPIAWWLSPVANGPFREILFQDFNGDGRTDIACLTAEDELSVWTVGEQGIERTPAFQHTFSSPVTRMLLAADLEGQGAVTLVLECNGTLQILRPQSPLSVY